MHRRWISLLAAATAAALWTPVVAAAVPAGGAPAPAPGTAPATPVATAAAGLSWADLNAQISQASDQAARYPDDVASRRRLAILYIQRLGRPEASAAVQEESITRALELLEWAYQKNPNDLDTAGWLAQAQRLKDPSAAGAGKALDTCAAFIDGAEPGQRSLALLARARLVLSLRLSAEGYAQLVKHGQMRLANPIDEAIATIRQAVDAEPKDSDEAERTLADLYFTLGRFADADAMYTRVLEMNRMPAHRDAATLRLIECELRENTASQQPEPAKLRDAAGRLDVFLEEHPDNVQALNLRALGYFRISEGAARLEDRRGLLQKARDDVNRILDQNPGNYSAIYYRARILMQLSDADDEKLIGDLQQQIRLGHTDANTVLLQIQFLQRQQHPEAAVELLRQLLQREPERVDLVEADAQLLLQLARQAQSLPKGYQGELSAMLAQIAPQAVLDRLLPAAAQHWPSDARWPLLRAQALLAAGHVDEAAAAYAELRRLRPGDMGVLEGYLRALRATHDDERALDTVTPAIDSNAAGIDSHPERLVFYFHRAAALLALKRDDAAAQDMERALDIAVRLVNKAQNTAVLEMLLNQGKTVLPAEALAAYLRSRLAKNPSDLLIRAALLAVLNESGVVEEALQVARETPLPITVDLLLQEKALAEMRGGDREAADRDFGVLVPSHGNDIVVLNNHAMFLAEQMNRPDEALAEAERARQLLVIGLYDAGKWSAVYNTLGYVELRRGNFPEAANLLRRSLRMQPTSSTYAYLAIALQKGGRGAEATKVLMAAVTLDPHFAAELTKAEQAMDGPKK